MKPRHILIIGATGHVGSQVVNLLAKRGHRVRALVRRTGAKIHQAPTSVTYTVGDLSDPVSIQRALVGIDTVVSTANGIIPQRADDTALSVNEGIDRLINLCVTAGVRRFVQSSVPVHAIEEQVPELAGKRHLERCLLASPLRATIVRNPAFMDVWLVMCGFQQAESQWPHATTRRNYGFMRRWRSTVGNFVLDRGWFIAPGGARHGSPLITTRDAAELLAAGAVSEGDADRIIEVGGPRWLTWRQVAAQCALATGRDRLWLIPLPAWVARLGQVAVRPFSPAAANVLALLRYVATHQPRYDDRETVRQLGVPEQQRLAQYLKAHYRP